MQAAACGGFHGGTGQCIACDQQTARQCRRGGEGLGHRAEAPAVREDRHGRGGQFPSGPHCRFHLGGPVVRAGFKMSIAERGGRVRHNHGAAGRIAAENAPVVATDIARAVPAAIRQARFGHRDDR